MSKVTFDIAAPPGTINFGIGHPSPDLLPADLLRTAADDFLSNATAAELNYGELQGDAGFRGELAALLTREYASPVVADDLFVTGGASQALDFVCSQLTQPGDAVIVEEPSYFLAFQIFRDHGLEIVPVPTDRDGLRLDALEEALKRSRPALVYTIPSFHNPGGQSLGAKRRERLAELSREHGFLIVADEVYQMLWYDRPPPPAMATLTNRGNILSLGSFSKILAPGLRLGWIQTSPELMRPLLGAGVVNSGGSFSFFVSQVVRQVMRLGLQDPFLLKLRDAYGRRVEAMDSALHEHLGDRARWLRPGGGYFFWLEFDPLVDTAGLRSSAGDFEVGFQPGVNFSSRGGLGNCMRLSFAHYSEEEIREGIRRLARLVAA